MVLTKEREWESEEEKGSTFTVLCIRKYLKKMRMFRGWGKK